MSVLLSNEENDRKEFLAQMNRTVASITEAISDGRAYTGPEPRELAEEISSYEILPEHGLGFDKTMANVEKSILPNFLRTSSTQYMAHLHSPTLRETIAAELILSSFNQSMDSWDQSPVATETEVAVIRKLCSLYGYNSSSDGSFTSGGSQSNLTGILLAREWFCNTQLNHDVKKKGLAPHCSKFRLYTSEVSHFSMEKSCHLLGLGYDAIVKVPVDSKQKMDTAALRRLISEDKAKGNIPFCIVATIGTTDYGSIDSVEELRKIADENNAWLHADAAYGSALILSDKYSKRLGPLHQCDSITVDFHKMFLLPISCSAILVKDGSQFNTLELHADYLNREEDEEDGYTNLVGKSIQTTRRFDALKVWMAFQCQGKDGYSSMLNTCVENAAYVYSQLKARKNFEPAIEPEISSVVFRVTAAGDGESGDELNKKIRRTLIHKDGIVIGQTVYNGRTHLKFTLLNPRLTHKMLDSLLDTIESLT